MAWNTDCVVLNAWIEEHVIFFLQSGDKCQNAIDYCSPSPCQNGGVCESKPVGYTCTCPELHTGKNCERVVCQVSTKWKQHGIMEGWQ